jgi:hypothetical protein
LDLSSASSGLISSSDEGGHDLSDTTLGSSLYDISDTVSSSSDDSLDSHSEALDHTSLDALLNPDSDDEGLDDLSDGDADDEGGSEGEEDGVFGRQCIGISRWVCAGVFLYMSTSDRRITGTRAD